ncbi:MAG: glycosyltransferase family 2 protein [Butyrivibrio sp.]|nr:glycosyltransferase family 2 protein [Butyrivibrio sp.]
MENEIKYQQALELFEREDYEGAVELFIHLYEAGYEKEAILQILYDCFVTPNEAEFVKNYQNNCENLCDNDYNSLLLDFIPVSDTKYYIFHKALRQFFGSIDISGEVEEPKEAEIHSVLIADIWDLREMIPYIGMRGWNTCYILLGENRNEFLSFLKLPDIQRKYLRNSMVFTDVEIMKQFFIKYPEHYIPKQIISGHPAEYREILYELHRIRLEDTQLERKNILLSVCIPSYGRGSICLENVQNILQVEYDAEIEIVVSNNGSTEDTEGYEAIKNLRDSRVTYHEFDENQGYGANVCKALELAKGQFIVFTSDEDFMKVENLHSYMNYLINNKTDGVIQAAGIGPNFRKTEEMHLKSGIDTLKYMINNNYLTGVTLNSFWVRNNNVLQRVAQNRENKFVSIYVHIALALLTAERTSASFSDIVLWVSVTEQDNVEESSQEILSYMHYNSRIEQQNSAIEFVENAMNLNSDELLSLIMERIGKTYILCKLAYMTRMEAYRKLIDWRALCTLLHRNNMKLLERYENERVNFKQFIDGIFFKYVTDNPLKTVLSQRELEDYEMVENIAMYLFNHGKPISEIDYPELERKWREFAEKI